MDAVEWGKECFGIIRVPLFRSGAISAVSYIMDLRVYHGLKNSSMTRINSCERLKNNNPTFEKVYPSKGFGWYLSNSFVSIARSQMLESIIKLEIMTEEEVKEALEGGENARLRVDYANK